VGVEQVAHARVAKPITIQSFITNVVFKKESSLTRVLALKNQGLSGVMDNDQPRPGGLISDINPRVSIIAHHIASITDVKELDKCINGVLRNVPEGRNRGPGTLIPSILKTEEVS
jgi:hypothetical protein